MRNRSIHHRRGVSLVEVLLVIAVLALGMVAAARSLKTKLSGFAGVVGDHVISLTPFEGHYEPATPPVTPPAPSAPPVEREAVADKFAGLQPCLVHSFEATRRESYTLGWSYDESGSAYQHQKLSNGTEIFYEGNWSGSGTDVGAAIEVPVYGIPVALAGGITLSGATENGYLWVLDSQAQRDAERKLRRDIAVDAYIRGPQIPDLNDPNWLQNETMRARYMDLIKHQNVDRLVTKVSKNGQVSLGADALGLSADLTLGAGVAKTVEQDRDGTRVITYELNAAASQELGHLVYGEYAVGAEARFTVAVSVDAQGAVTGVDITGIQGIKQGHNSGFDVERLDSFAQSISENYDGLAKPLGKLGKALNTTVEYTDRDDATAAMRVNLHIDPQQSQVDVQALAQVLSRPTLGSTRRLVDSLSLEGSNIDLQLYTSRDHIEDTTLKVQLGVGAGASSTSIDKNLTLADAWTLSNDGLQHRTDCVP